MPRLPAAGWVGMTRIAMRFACRRDVGEVESKQGRAKARPLHILHAHIGRADFMQRRQMLGGGGWGGGCFFADAEAEDFALVGFEDFEAETL
jgi:hypothetical protein